MKDMVGPEGGDSDPRAGRSALQASWNRLPGNLRGALWMLAAAGSFTVMVSLIKLAGKTFHVTEILLFRQIFMMLLVMPVLCRNFPASLMTRRPGLQLIRVLAALGAMMLSFTAFIHLPLAEAVTISFARTFFITIFALLILHEVVGIRRWGAMIVGFAGVVLVAQPGVTGGFNVYGLMAVAGAACGALVMIIIRIVSRTDKPVTIMTYQALGVGLAMIPFAYWNWRTPTFAELLLLAAIGVVSSSTQLCNIYAFRAAEASAIAPLDYTRLVWATALGLLLFAEWPGLHVFAGASVIIAAGLYTMYREQKLGRERATKDAPPPV